MTPMEADLLKMEMDQTLKQAEDALKEVRKDAAQEKRTWVVELAPQTAELFARCVALLKPPPGLTLSQWADTYRMLSAENSAAPGRWHTENAPYQREIMDAIGDPHIRKVVIMSAAQIGKTAMLMNMLGYYMHYYPAPVLVMQPTLEMGQTFSKDFLAPMIRDTPVLTRLVDTKSRYSGNTILKKNFPGGHVTIIGANSPASLASRPIKVLLCDEVDRYPESAGTEGDLLGQENGHCLHADHQGTQPHRNRVPGDDAGRVDGAMPWVRTLPAPGLVRREVRQGRPDEANPVQVREVRGAVRGIRVEAARATGALPGGESDGGGAGVPPEHTGLQLLRLA